MSAAGAVIFDFDGCLADSVDLYHQLYAQCARAFGRPWPYDDREAFRRWYDARWEENYRNLGFSGQELQDAMQWLLERVSYDQVQFYPGLRDAVRRLAEAHPLAIASTTPAEHIEPVLNREGVRDCFVGIWGGGPDGSSKINLVGGAWQALGQPAGRTVMVGDTALDVETAHHWGLLSVGVTYGWMSPDRVEASRPTRVVSTPSQLHPVLSHLLG
ncbi:MAG: HAD family hydrolase [Candidatus Xenobia bacterium]